MSRAAIEAPAPIPAADGIWRPAWIESRQAYVCERTFMADKLDEIDGKLTRETHGARMSGPHGERFSPLYVFRETDAKAQCDRLNAEAANG